MKRIKNKELILLRGAINRKFTPFGGVRSDYGIAIAPRVAVARSVTNSEQVCDKSIRTLDFPYVWSTYQG